MNRGEWAARWLVAGAALGLPLALLGARTLERRAAVVEVHARTAETGGWLPGDLTVAAGEPLHLRLVSDDVLHGFAVGQLDAPAVNLPPGQVVETTVTFDEPGTYTYYCTRWCGLGHWRMRGTITVTGAEELVTPAPEPPLYVTLGINLDAPHPAARVPAAPPRAEAGAAWAGGVPAALLDRRVYAAASPADVWARLRSEAALGAADDQAVWDLVAWVWQTHTSASELALGRELYAANCAACHGETGAGDGVFAAQLAPAGHVEAGHGAQAPVSFRDPASMLGVTSAGLHGKILRGGMGTGMPYWGPVFTEAEVWSLVAYLWRFQFE